MRTFRVLASSAAFSLILPPSIRRHRRLWLLRPSRLSSRVELAHNMEDRARRIILGERVLWDGPMFGRLTKSARDCLLQRGWKRVNSTDRYTDTVDISTHDDNSNQQRLAFAWPSKSGPQFEVNDTTAAHIRPYPKHMTDILDDKVRLANVLEGLNISPECVSTPDQAKERSKYFVKHRLGAQGKSVYVYNKQELMTWWSRTCNPQDFVIQEEILSALSPDKRKFVLRSHILLFQRDGEPLQAFLHKHVICQHHASTYDSHEKSAQISQAGKRHPAPILVLDLDPHHPAANMFPQIVFCSKLLVSAIRDNLSCPTSTEAMVMTTSTQATIGRDTTCFSLLGVDSLVSKEREIQVCEVNSHPALGWGTMSKVPSKVFSDLIEDTTSLLFDGVSEESEKGLTGFIPIL